jgi:hypothetical protein
VTQGALALAVSLFLFGAAPPQSTQQQTAALQNVPDAPAPAGLDNLADHVKPGAGTAPQPAENTQQTAPPQSQPPANAQQPNTQQEPPVIPKTYEEASQYVIHVPVNYVDVPVTVRDKHHQLVPGLDWRQFKVYEDGQEQHIAFFSTDPLPLSVAFVIDQSLPADIMRKVNQSLGAVAGAFSPADSVAVFTSNSSPEVITTFTGSQGPRRQAARQSA